MPTYEYQCEACGHRFDELQKFSDPPLKKCPACKKSKLERLFGGGGAIIFKGSGFYETDYRRAGDAPSSGKADGEAAKPDSATETKSEAKTESKPAESSTPAPSGSSDGGKKAGGGGKKAK